MKNKYLISKKIDKNNQFVFLKKPKIFLIVDNIYLQLFNDFYYKSSDKLKKTISKISPNTNTNKIYSELNELLNTRSIKITKSDYEYIIPKNLKKFKLRLGDSCYTINYDDSQLINTVIGQLFHLEDNSNLKSKNYYIFNSSNGFFLNNDYENLGSWNKKEIHYLTGKLLSLIMCDFHKVEEKKWSAFLHASAVSKDGNAIVIVGESGSGKSTACAILSKNDYNLLADDTTPISRDGKVGNFPNSISIKEPSFKKINDLFSKANISDTINISKGKIKYLNPHGLKSFTPKTINCSTILRIKYNPKKENSLKKIKLKDLLPLIVNESFFPTNLKSVDGFMNWFINCKCYTLTYNNDESLINFFKELEY